MDKAQAIHQFWNSFGLIAYDENTVPEDAVMPYITYYVSTGALDQVQNLYANLYYKSYSWEEITKKSDEIAKAVAEHGFHSIPLDNGYAMITPGFPFAQRMNDPSDDTVRRMYLRVDAEFLTAY